MAELAHKEATHTSNAVYAVLSYDVATGTRPVKRQALNMTWNIIPATPGTIMAHA